ncbi:MAG: WG repeat-containing protein [Cetobacterium sp.]
MKKIKLVLVVGILFFIGIYFKNMNVKSKEIEIELQDENIGNFYKEYIITKPKNGIRLKNYFNNKDIFIEKDGVKNIITLQEKYELLQLESQIYLKNIDKIKIIDGVNKIKIGENYIFKKDDKYGVIDKNLNILIEPLYDGLFKGEKSTLILAKQNNKYGYLSLDGKVVIPFEYEIGAVEKNGVMIVKKNNKIGAINENNEEVIKFDYDGIYYNDSTKFIAVKNKEYFLIDNFGKKERINASWMGVQKNEKLFYEKDGKFGIFDFQKEYITGNIYDELSQNYNELIIAMKDKNYGLINNRGEIKLPFKYDYIVPVGESYFKIGNDTSGFVFLVNSNGEVITKQIYDDFIELNKKTIVGMKKDKLILIDQRGKKIKEIDSIINFNNEMLLYKKDGKNILRKL